MNEGRDWIPYHVSAKDFAIGLNDKIWYLNFYGEPMQLIPDYREVIYMKKAWSSSVLNSTYTP